MVVKMSNLIIRPSIEKYIEASDEILKLLDKFLTIWKEKDKEIDVIEARRIYMFMINEDQKSNNSHIKTPRIFDRHSWVVGEYASDIARKLIDKYYNIKDIGLKLTPEEILYAGGSHDVAKMLLKNKYQYAHEHLAWIIMNDNGYSDLASLTQPHHPGEEKVLKMIHGAEDFRDVKEDEFCKNRKYPLESDLIMLADMSCVTGYDGPTKRMRNIRKENPSTDHLVVGINDPERGEKRILDIETRINDLLQKN